MVVILNPSLFVTLSPFASLRVNSAKSLQYLAQGKLREESDTGCHPERSEGSHWFLRSAQDKLRLSPQNDITTQLEDGEHQVTMEENILKEEKGVALVIALLMMLVLTLIGISSIGTTNFETSISGNERVRTDAFYAAEAGIQVAINQVPDNMNPIKNTPLKENSYYRTTTDVDGNPKSKIMGLHPKAGFDSTWAFKRFQVNMTGESFGATKELEVQVTYGPFRASTEYN